MNILKLKRACPFHKTLKILFYFKENLKYTIFFRGEYK